MVIKITENPQEYTLDMDITDIYTYTQVGIAKIIMDFIAQLNDYSETMEKYPEIVKTEFSENKGEIK